MTIDLITNILYKGSSHQLVAAFIGTLVAISEGMQYGWSAPVLPILLSPNSPIQITQYDAEWLETCYLIGALCGIFMTMYLVDKIGRRRSILLSSFLNVCFWISMASAPSFGYLLIARTFSGLISNISFVVIPMYIAEIADKKIRGFIGSLFFLMMLVGILLIYSVAPFVPIYAHCILGASIALIELLTFPFMPESPYYLVFRNRLEEAKRSLKWFRGRDSEIDREFEEIKCGIARQKEETGKILDLLLVPSNRRAIVIMIVLNSAQHFSSISVLLMNFHSILKEGGTEYMKPSTTGIVFAMLMLLSAGIASFFMDKCGRRSLLISSSLLTGLCLLFLAIYFSIKSSGYDTSSFSWIPTACVMMYALAFKIGLGLVPIVLTAELFSAKMKTYGMTLADGVYVLSSALSLVLYQRLAASFGIEYPFYLFSICCFLTVIFTYFYIPETKGKSLEDIQIILQKGCNSHKYTVKGGS